MKDPSDHIKGLDLSWSSVASSFGAPHAGEEGAFDFSPCAGLMRLMREVPRLSGGALGAALDATGTQVLDDAGWSLVWDQGLIRARGLILGGGGDPCAAAVSMGGAVAEVAAMAPIAGRPKVRSFHALAIGELRKWAFNLQAIRDHGAAIASGTMIGARLLGENEARAALHALFDALLLCEKEGTLAGVAQFISFPEE